MKARYLLPVVGLCLTTLSLSAQNDAQPSIVSYEARLAFDVSSNTGASAFYDTGAGFTAGGVAQIRMPRNFFFMPGVLFYYTAWSIDNDRLEALKLYSGSASNFGIRVPVSVGYDVPLLPNLSLQAYTGPWLNVNLRARQTLSAAPGSPFEDFYETNLFKDGFRRVDAQWGFGLNLTWEEHYVLGVSFGVGMTPMRKFSSLHNEMTQRRNSFQVNLGYRF
ncbi:MAG: PorT family protein [Muribaculaceae bacterium]|nr:PorT family protein [Muribaculaceae bacterium]